MAEAKRASPVVRVRPRGGLLVVAVLTLLLVTAPLYGALYWFAAQNGLVWQTLAGHLAVVLIGVAVGLRQLSVFVEVRDGVLRGNGIFSPVQRAPLSSIARVDLVATYVGLRPTPVQQLLVRDAEGRRLFRMRGNFWHDDALAEVVAALPVPATVITEPIDQREFFRRYPGSAYWFENRPAVMIVAIVLGGLLLVAIAAGSVALAGEPFGF